jgi:hypothetical protein
VGIGDGGEGTRREEGERQRLEQGHVETILTSFLKCLTDYSTDNRGDVGSWVREAGMQALEQVVPLVVTRDSFHPNQTPWLSPRLVKQIMDELIQQLCEKIDRIRTQAGASLLALLRLQPPLPDVPQRELLIRVLENESNPSAQVDWKAPAATFPRVVELLASEDYTLPAVSGLVISIGGLSESLVKHSWDATLRLLQREPSKTPSHDCPRSHARTRTSFPPSAPLDNASVPPPPPPPPPFPPPL